MGILFGFLPFIAFSVLQNRTGSAAALGIGAAIALVLVIRSKLLPPHHFKILELGTLVAMAVLGAYSYVAGSRVSVPQIQLLSSCGLLIVVLISLAVRQPFTLQYARDQVDRTRWDTPRFIQVNYIITGAWAVAFAVMACVNLLILLVPSIPQYVGLAATLLCLTAGFVFTRWYSARARSEARAAV